MTVKKLKILNMLCVATFALLIFSLNIVSCKQDSDNTGSGARVSEVSTANSNSTTSQSESDEQSGNQRITLPANWPYPSIKPPSDARLVSNDYLKDFDPNSNGSLIDIVSDSEDPNAAPSEKVRICAIAFASSKSFLEIYEEVKLATSSMEVSEMTYPSGMNPGKDGFEQAIWHSNVSRNQIHLFTAEQNSVKSTILMLFLEEKPNKASIENSDAE